MTSIKVSGIKKSISTKVAGKEELTAKLISGNNADISMCASSEMFVRIQIGKTFTIIGGTISTLPSGGYEGYILIKNSTGGGVWVHPDVLGSENIIGENKTFVNAINAVIKYLKSIEPGGAGTGNGTLVNIVKTIDDTELSDINVMSSLRTLLEIENNNKELQKTFLSKINPDKAAELIQFAKGAEFGEFSSGMSTGKGGRIDERGNGELESLVIRSLLEVPEIRYNRETLIGDSLTVGSGGLIVKAEQQSASTYELTMKLEEGEMIPFLEDDILKGIFNQSGGFVTSWMRVDKIDQSAGTMVVTMGADSAVPAGKNYPPCDFMVLAKRGNFTKKERQSCLILDAKAGKIVMLDGVDNYMAGEPSFQLGKPAGLEHIVDFSKLPVNPEQSYLYVRGLLVQDLIKIDYKGLPIKEIRDRGVWNLTTAQSDNPYRCIDTMQDDVWMPYGRYRCIVDKTLQKPAFGVTDWIQVEGDPRLYIEFYSSEGFGHVLGGEIDTKISIRIFRGAQEITAFVRDTDIKWTRDSGVPTEDTIWNNAHADAAKEIRVTNKNGSTDLGSNWFKRRYVEFKVKAFVRDGENSEFVEAELPIRYGANI